MVSSKQLNSNNILPFCRLQQLFSKKQETEHELETRLSKYRAQEEFEKHRLNVEFLKLQNPTFTELSIRETTEFDFPEM